MAVDIRPAPWQHPGIRTSHASVFGAVVAGLLALLVVVLGPAAAAQIEPHDTLPPPSRPPGSGSTSTTGGTTPTSGGSSTTDVGVLPTVTEQTQPTSVTPTTATTGVSSGERGRGVLSRTGSDVLASVVVAGALLGVGAFVSVAARRRRRAIV